MTLNIDEAEFAAKKYTEQKQQKELKSELKNTVSNIIDLISADNFVFPLKQEGVISNGTTTYIYSNNMTYPYLFEFIAEILHMRIPITINDTKFGPGEVIVNKENEKEVQEVFTLCVKELQKLLYAKKP
jgi:hypothetical protein